MIIAVDKALINETENVTNMPKLAHIEIHRSEDTGNLYIHHISWMEDQSVSKIFNHGMWYDTKPISEEDVNAIIDILLRNTPNHG